MLSKTIDAVLYEGQPEDADDPSLANDGATPSSDGSTPTTRSNSPQSLQPGAENGIESSSNTNAIAPVQEEEPTQIEYSKLLQFIKSKEFETALQKMERDTDEYGRFLKQASESHIVAPADVLEFVIKAKFFDSVRSNNKHVSAIYAVLYMALEIDATEALHFLLIHTSAEFETACNGIITSSIGSFPGESRQGRQQGEQLEDDGSSDLVRSDIGREMAVPNALSKIFEAVTRMMDDYAYVETFGLKRTLLVLRCIQPVLERHALSLMNFWLQSSRFDEYSLIIPGNDWKLYEDFQLAKLNPTPPSTTEASTATPTPTVAGTSNATAAVPSVRVGGKLDPMRIVLTLDQFSVISQLVESYKAYIRRLYEKGIEEMREKGHSFVDMGEAAESHDGLPHISNASERVHNIRAYVSEPSNLFVFLQRKSESYKQLESWFLGSALFAAYAPPSTASSITGNSPNKKLGDNDDAHTDSKPSTPAPGDREKEGREGTPPIVSEPPTAAAVFAAQKIDQVFALLLRSMERAVSTKQFDVSLTLIKRAVALMPSFVLSLFLRHITATIPKITVDSTSDIATSILTFHGEDTDEARPKKKAVPKPSSSPGPASLWSAGFGGLMNLVGTTAPTSLIPGSKGISDGNLVNPPKPNVWIGLSLANACASLNDLALCSKYFPKLHDDIEKKVRYFDRSAENRAAILQFLSHLKEHVPALFDVTPSVQTLTYCLYPALSYFMHQFYRTSYEIGDEEYRAMELNDPWSSITIAWIKTAMEPLKPALQPQVMDLWVGQVAGVVADTIAKLVLRKQFTAFGALAFDSHLRKVISMFNALLPQSSSFTVRHKFAALKEVTTILSMENEREILEIWNASHEDQSQFFDPSLDSVPAPTAAKVTVKWHLSSAQVKAYMKCRTEWKAGIIDSLVLS